MRIPIGLIRLFLNLDRYLVMRVFQPLVITIFKHTGVGNYTIAKYLLISASAIQVGLFLLTAGLFVTSAILIPHHLWFAYTTVHYMLTSMFVFLLFRCTRHYKRVATILEANHIKMAAYGSLPDYLDPQYLAVFMRVVLLFGYMVTVQLDIVRWIVASILRGKVVIFIDDLIYLAAFTLLCAGCYFTACKHPPPSSRREPAQGRLSYAWG
ncbi:MAG TPA: hypothetical protein VEA92_01780 [Candidatus Paceibacterota bacterium]|nr:hypothetical protein [Candidatus Paceibacterota bacterium]